LSPIKKSLCLLLLAAALIAPATLARAQNKARAGAISNILLAEEGGGVKICYDLGVDSARVKLIGIREGAHLAIKAVTGDVGIVIGPKKGLCLFWKISEDYPAGLGEKDVSLDVVAEELAAALEPAPQNEGQAKDFQSQVSACVTGKMDTRFNSEKDTLNVARSEYFSLLNADQAPFTEMMSKIKGGTPYIRKWERDRDGRQVPVYDTDPLPEREKAKFQRELDKQLEKAERSPTSVISLETRRAKERYEQALERLFTRIASACEKDTGQPVDKILEWIEKAYAQTFYVPEPFSFIKKERNWD